jgi:hypothetical protein
MRWIAKMPETKETEGVVTFDLSRVLGVIFIGVFIQRAWYWEIKDIVWTLLKILAGKDVAI